VQMVCALVKPTIMARKIVRASRGTDPKRPAEPRRAESRHDREAARAHIDPRRAQKRKGRDPEHSSPIFQKFIDAALVLDASTRVAAAARSCLIDLHMHCVDDSALVSKTATTMLAQGS